MYPLCCDSCTVIALLSMLLLQFVSSTNPWNLRGERLGMKSTYSVHYTILRGLFTVQYKQAPKKGFEGCAHSLLN
jgi:hypothetical protein